MILLTQTRRTMKKIIIDFEKFIQTWRFDKLEFETSSSNLSHIFQNIDDWKDNFNQIKRLEKNELSTDNVLFLVKWWILEYNNSQYIIQDIGYDVIKQILEDKFNQNIINGLNNIVFK